MTTAWDTAPAQARWYGEVIAEPTQGGDVDYFYGYSDAIKAPAVDLLVPENWTFLESTVQEIPGRS